MTNINTHKGQIGTIGHPNKCPYCHKTISPNYLYGHFNNGVLEVAMVCPDQSCNKCFIGYYEKYLNKCFEYNGCTSVGNLEGKAFSNTINSISQSFTTIYNQAYAAEQQNLTEICGVGYRKALEFLIKDYIISNMPTEKDTVEKKLLGACIAEYVEDHRIKIVAKRAVWLGNDETHYVRKWDGKNLQDLKKLIDLTVHWIEMETLTNSLESEMPE